MKIVLFDQQDLDHPCFKKLEKELGIEIEVHADRITPETLHYAKGADAVNITYSRIGNEILQELHDMGVQYLSTRSIGFDHIDLEAAKKIGLKVGNSSYSPHNVAEYAVMFILMSLRNAKRHLDGNAYQDFVGLGQEGKLLANSTVGIIGTGRIGATVAKMLQGFDCRVLAYDLYPNDEVRKYAEYTDLDTLLGQSDIITLHMPATDENYHMINAETIAKMKKGAHLVNTARGVLVDSSAVIDGLESGQLGGVALDVIEGEVPWYQGNCAGEVIPVRDLNTLRGMAKVIMTGHQAWNTQDATDETLENALRSCYWELTGQKNPYRLV